MCRTHLMATVSLLLCILLIPERSQARGCEITGHVPSQLHNAICYVATSAHGDTKENENNLTLAATRDMAYLLRAKNLDAEQFMLQMLETWMRLRKVRVASIYVFYGKVHLATVKTRLMGGPKITYH